MLYPPNFVGVLGHRAPTSPQSFTTTTFVGLEMPYSLLLGGVQEITFCASSPPTVVTSCVLNRTRSTAGPPRRGHFARFADRGVDRKPSVAPLATVGTRADDEKTRSDRAQRVTTPTCVVPVDRRTQRTRPVLAADVLWAVGCRRRSLARRRRT